MTLLELLALMRKRLRLVILLPLACAAVAGAYCYLAMGNSYTATTSMYVLALQESASTNFSSDLSASQMIANDVSTLLESDRVAKETAADLGIEDINDYEVAVTSETTSRVITLSVTGPDPELAADIANNMVENVSNIAREVMSVESVNPIDEALVPASPSGPNRPLYVAVALLGGLFAAVAIVVLADMLNMRVRGAEEAEELLGIPVIGRVPELKEAR